MDWSKVSPNDNLVMDIGVSEGNDTAYYLAKGFDVIGVEADPKSCENVVKRFAREVQDGKLCVLNFAASERSGDKLKIFVHNVHQGISGQSKRAEVPDNYSEYDVRTIDWLTLIAQKGLPRYVKIDIEGAEAPFLRGMLESRAFPEFISVECHKFEPIALLKRMGYRRFKLVDQKPYQIGRDYKLPESQKEGVPLKDFVFAHSSGPFGRDVFDTDVWIDADAIEAEWTAISGCGTTWHDCHAWMPKKLDLDVSVLNSIAQKPTGCFRIISAHGTCVAASASDGAARAAPLESFSSAQLVPLYGWTFETHPNMLLIAAEQPASALVIGGEKFPHAAAWLKLEARDGGFFHLRHLRTGRYLCAHPAKEGLPSPVEINRVEAREWEIFRLEAVEPQPIFPLSREVIELLKEDKDVSWSVDAIKAVLLSLADQLGPDLASLDVAKIPPEQIAALGDWLVESPEAIRRLASLYPGDPWAVHALPRLVDWIGRTQQEREKCPRIERVTADFDPVAERDMAINPRSLPFALNADMRGKVEPSKEICLIATVRNEGLYLLEWLAWHRCLGIKDFFVYSNDNTDGSDALLFALARAGLITWLENSDHGAAPPQFKAYGHALSVVPQILNYRWAAIIDADEFIMLDFDKYDGIMAFMNSQNRQGVDAIGLNWLFFGANGHQAWSDDLTIRRFKSREPCANNHVKVILRPNKFLYSTCHYPIAFRHAKYGFFNERGTPHIYLKSGRPALSDKPSAENAWINHYYCRSAREFIWKKARGYGDQRNDYAGLFAPLQREQGRFEGEFRYGLQFVRETNYINDARALRRAPMVDWEIANMLSDPAIKLAHTAVIESATEGMKRAINAFRDLPAEIVRDDLKQIWLSAAGAD